VTLPFPPLPFPPNDLLQRTGNVDPNDAERAYDAVGRGIRSIIESLLPSGWIWSGKRVLDFGCGAGRVLRQFQLETKHAEFLACDIHRPSIDWINENLSPPFTAVYCDEAPALIFPNGYFSLVYAISVFTHLTDHSAGWLLELRRILADDGFLLVTFLGEGMIDEIIHEEWKEDRIGFNAVRHGDSWDHGGPMTFISPWWIRAHWGRAFDIVELRPYTGHIAGKPFGHGLLLMRKRPRDVTIEDIVRIEPNEPREIAALQHNIAQLSKELRELRAWSQSLSSTA
jgi:SAM-dependent methyltransferase